MPEGPEGVQRGTRGTRGGPEGPEGPDDPGAELSPAASDVPLPAPPPRCVGPHAQPEGLR